MIYDNRNLKAFCEICQGIERQTPCSQLTYAGLHSCSDKSRNVTGCCQQPSKEAKHRFAKLSRQSYM